MFGAGASAFSQEKSCAPPLGDELFDALVKEYDGWRSLPEETQLEFKSAPQGFEHAMARVAASNEPLIPQLLREMAIFFLKFELKNDSLYLRFLKSIYSNQRGMRSFSTLNYDTLFEQAGIATGEKRGVFKLHGCPTLTPDQRFSVKDVAFVGFDAHYDGSVTEMGLDEARLHWNCENSVKGVAPVMALYAPEKPVLYAPSLVRDIQREWAEHIQSAQRVLIIGMRRSVSDDHIWGPLAKTDARVAFINPCEEDISNFEEWAKQERPDRPCEVGRLTFEAFIQCLERNRLGDALRRLG